MYLQLASDNVPHTICLDVDSCLEHPIIVHSLCTGSFGHCIIPLLLSFWSLLSHSFQVSVFHHCSELAHYDSLRSTSPLHGQIMTDFSPGQFNHVFPSYWLSRALVLRTSPPNVLGPTHVGVRISDVTPIQTFRSPLSLTVPLRTAHPHQASVRRNNHPCSSVPGFLPTFNFTESGVLVSGYPLRLHKNHPPSFEFTALLQYNKEEKTHSLDLKIVCLRKYVFCCCIRN